MEIQTTMSIKMIFNYRRNVLAFFLGLSALAIGNESKAQNNPAVVSPLLTGHYSPGLLDIRDFANPAPASGIIIIDYNTFLSGNKFYDKDGNQVTQITGPAGASVVLKPDVSGYINVPMAMWVAKSKILGATYFGGALIPYVTVNPSLAYSRIGITNSAHQSGDVSGHVSGFSDLGVMPVTLSWGLKNFDLTAGYSFYAPTGKYTSGGSDNIGLGFWSHIFQLFGYWYPMKVEGKPSKALAIMFATSYELTSKIKDADVKPGNRFSLDYGISQYFTDRLELGIYGGNNWQISNDNGSEVYWDGQVKDKLGVLGFQASYWLWAGRLQAIGKYGFNYGAVQRFNQNTIAVNLIFITNALTGNKAAKGEAGK